MFYVVACKYPTELETASGLLGNIGRFGPSLFLVATLLETSPIGSCFGCFGGDFVTRLPAGNGFIIWVGAIFAPEPLIFWLSFGGVGRVVDWKR